MKIFIVALLLLASVSSVASTATLKRARADSTTLLICHNLNQLIWAGDAKEKDDGGIEVYKPSKAYQIIKGG